MPTTPIARKRSRAKRSRAPSGRFGGYGGRYIPETLATPLDQLEAAWSDARRDRGFGAELKRLLSTYCGRPTPLYFAARLSAATGVRVWLKREDLLHTGAHKINNALGQALLARRMGKRRIVAETGAGQHGVATATACALLGLDAVVYMGEVDMARQAPNVERMKLLGAEVRSVASGSRTLKDAINEALRDWVTNVGSTHYILGSVLGPHPFPSMVADFHAVIGKEARAQFRRATGRLPAAAIACVGGGSNAIGLFSGFLDDAKVELVGVEAGGRGRQPGQHAARFAAKGGAVGVLHGTKTYVLQDEHGQVLETHSISAGLDYPAIGPMHAELHDSGRARYVSVSDVDALRAFRTLARLEGILPALESAHAVAYVLGAGRRRYRGRDVIVNLSGRGDKDLATVLGAGGVK